MFVLVFMNVVPARLTTHMGGMRNLVSLFPPFSDTSSLMGAWLVAWNKAPVHQISHTCTRRSKPSAHVLLPGVSGSTFFYHCVTNHLNGWSRSYPSMFQLLLMVIAQWMMYTIDASGSSWWKWEMWARLLFCSCCSFLSETQSRDAKFMSICRQSGAVKYIFLQQFTQAYWRDPRLFANPICWHFVLVAPRTQPSSSFPAEAPVREAPTCASVGKERQQRGGPCA